MEKLKLEKCYYCNNNSEYNDLAKQGDFFFVTGVCKDHMTNYSNPS